MTLPLTRYWFRTEHGSGYGVTGYSLEDAQILLAQKWPQSVRTKIVEIIPDVDMRALDQDHVAPNMGVCSVRGVWFPNSN